MPTPNHQPPSQWTAPPFRLALGTMAFDRAKGEASPEALLERAAQAGIRAIDTAPLYGFGEVESRIGQWFRAHGKVFEVWTKAGLEWDEAGHGEILFETESSSGKRLVVRRDSRPESLLRSIERSLERLGVEAIDLIQIHQRDRLVPLDESLSALFDAWRAKKVKAIGVSNFTPKDLDEGARVLLRLSRGTLSLGTAQYPLSLIDQKAKRDVFPIVRRHGLGFLAYSPLGQGLLSGAFTHAPPPDWRASLPVFSAQSRRLIHECIRRELEPLAHRWGVPLSSLAIGWVISHKEVGAALIGARTLNQLEEALKVIGLVQKGVIPFEDELRERLGEAFSGLGGDGTALQKIARKVKERLKRWFKKG